ncbi:hypothetical protein [Streptomyces flavofungini]|uniref:hypothetical protein n=1 Tax=Streptomyces flavofungini TaxID=68200 RepID=UPI0025B00713|nr:hypothetical protein [Streptomyces flavofungini]WJV49936.1 hypothetical protein QUY26_33080 [Streptomyces flavofungini]
MTYQSPFDGPSPWGETEAKQQPAGEAATAPAGAAPPLHPFMIGITLKAAAGFEAEWLTPRVYGATADEVAKRVVELVKALAEHQVIPAVSAAASKMRETHAAGGGAPSQAQAVAPKTFENGRVVAAPQGGNANQGPMCKCGLPSAYSEWGQNKFNPGPNRAYKCAKKVADYRDPSGCDFIQWVK